MRQTLASPLEKDEHYFSDDLRRYLLLEDHVISHQASCVIGEEGLKALATEYISSEQYIAAAKACATFESRIRECEARTSSGCPFI